VRRLRELNLHRDKAWERRMADGRTAGDIGCQDIYGCFKMKGPAGAELRVIASADEGWDHLSITTSLPRTPTWAEMEFVKRLFFAADEVAMQLHVPPRDHISRHDYCLHLWRPHAAPIPLPPAVFV
jgi:hypothetical protein